MSGICVQRPLCEDKAWGHGQRTGGSLVAGSAATAAAAEAAAAAAAAAAAEAATASHQGPASTNPGRSSSFRKTGDSIPLSMVIQHHHHPPHHDDHSNIDVATMDRDELQQAVVRAYLRLSRKEMVLLLSLRSLPTHGDDHQLAFRLTVHDLSHRTDLNTAPPRMHTPTPSEQSSPELSVSAPSSNSPLNADCYHPHTPPSETPPPPPPPSSSPHHDLPRLPLELWADIFENVGDWELATALGVHSNLRPTADWTRHATPLDCALLSGSVPRVAQFLSEHPHATFTRFGAKALIRFAYTDLLSLLRARRPQDFLAVFSQLSCRIPELASRFGQTKVLSWWLAASSPSATPSPSDGEDDASASPRLPPLPRDYDSEPLDEASRKGHIHVLQWWKTSGLPLRYGLAMDVASAWGQPAVLEWWKNSGLPLEYDRNALRSASYRGEVGVLEWWKRSGLRLIYDKDVLVEATKFNRVEVLEWWKHSGLTVHYLLIEIEAALEDAIGGGKEAMEWWKGNGARFDVAVREWTEEKTL